MLDRFLKFERLYLELLNILKDYEDVAYGSYFRSSSDFNKIPAYGTGKVSDNTYKQVERRLTLPRTIDRKLKEYRRLHKLLLRYVFELRKRGKKDKVLADVLFYRFIKHMSIKDTANLCNISLRRCYRLLDDFKKGKRGV